MFSKIEVNGDGACELYQWLRTQAGEGTDITWNFEKFIVDREGNVVERLSPMTTPDDLRPKVAAIL